MLAVDTHACCMVSIMDNVTACYTGESGNDTECALLRYIWTDEADLN